MIANVTKKTLRLSIKEIRILNYIDFCRLLFKMLVYSNGVFVDFISIFRSMYNIL